MKTKLYIIYNPTAGQRKKKQLGLVLHSLKNLNVFPVLLKTEHAGHATTLAHSVANQKGVTIVAAGGDGTVAEVAAGLIGTDARLGIIPIGTANVLAHEFSIPSEPDAIAKILTGSDARVLWPGIVDTQSGKRNLFVQMVSVGFDAQVVDTINLALKKIIGRYAYVVQALRELVRYKFSPLHVEVDGKTYKATGAIISKGRFYGGKYVISENANAEEPSFIVTILQKKGIIFILKICIALSKNRLNKLSGVICTKAENVRIFNPDNLPIQADGDIICKKSIIIHNSNQKIFLAAPSKQI
ncbi:YegS/Rv2252/BmrU family lipid kinase [Acetobacter sp. LMG 32666]|uniref:diacylglycerol/lipid kinase family protein n=1 Tax=Acetobacter sp. LMG 32666 TaxID=2959295 RepID=UPI0030C7BBC7